MYEFILRGDYDSVYNIYKDGNRVRDNQHDFCLKIDEKNKKVTFFNGWTAHKLVNVNDILYELLELLKIIDEGANEVSDWSVLEGYDYVINIALRKKLKKMEVGVE